MKTRGRRAPHRDAALCLRRFAYGDSSLVARLLTPQAGKLQVLAKGAYRPTSRYFGVIDLFDDLEVVWQPRASGALAVMTEGSILKRRRALTRDLGRYRAGLGVLEMADLVAGEGKPDVELFALTRAALDTLGGTPGGTEAEPRLVALAFDLKLLNHLGLCPALETCASCGRHDPGSKNGAVPFATALGGRLCHPCASNAGPGVGTASLHTLGIARSLMATPFANLERVRVAEPALDRTTALVQAFLDHHLETRPRSRRTTERPGRQPLPR